jgi:hypothetical protein
MRAPGIHPGARTNEKPAESGDTSQVGATQMQFHWRTLGDVTRNHVKCYMETTGIEPATSWLQIERSNRFSVNANTYSQITYDFRVSVLRFPGILEFFREI